MVIYIFHRDIPNYEQRMKAMQARFARWMSSTINLSLVPKE